jgi:hypothetical protein
VFVPNGDLSSLTDGAHCDRCSPLSLDQAIVNTLTAPDGSFKLSNVPAGDAIPIVVQLGNWRRRITLKIAPCVDNQVVDGTLRLSRSHSEGDIPLTAIATGYFDAPECVLLKMGLMDSEFSNPSGTGRIQLFTRTGSVIDSSTPLADSLYSSSSSMLKYNQVLFPCADDLPPGASALSNFLSYVNAGGRAFATDLSYAWLYNNGPLGSSVDWIADPSLDTLGPRSGVINTTFAKGADFAAWLSAVNALQITSPPTINIQESYTRAIDVVPDGGAQDWIDSTTPKSVQHFTIETPVNSSSDKRCGRVIYSSFYIVHGTSNPSLSFPASCGSDRTLSPQEKVLEFMILDLASCIRTDTELPPPAPPPPPPPPPPPRRPSVSVPSSAVHARPTSTVVRAPGSV